MERLLNGNSGGFEYEFGGNIYPNGKTAVLYRGTVLPGKTPLPTVLPASRVALLADDSNLYHSAKAVGSEFSYEKLIEKFASLQLVKALIFRVEPEYLHKNNGSTNRLTSLGYQVITKSLQVSPDGRKKGDIDIDLACQAFYLIPKVDVIFLASGDSDFVPLLKLLQGHSIAVHVLGFPGSTSHLLVRAADNFIPVGKDLLNGEGFHED